MAEVFPVTRVIDGTISRARDQRSRSPVGCTKSRYKINEKSEVSVWRKYSFRRHCIAVLKSKGTSHTIILGNVIHGADLFTWLLSVCEN